MNKFILTISIIIAVAVSFFYGKGISAEMQIVMYDALRITAGIIFGVLGAWAAIVFPNALANIFDKKHKNKKRELIEIKILIYPILISILIISITLISNIAIPVTTQIDFFQSNKNFFKSLSLFILIILTITQIWSLFASFALTENIYFKSRKQMEKEELIKSLTSNMQKINDE